MTATEKVAARERLIAELTERYNGEDPRARLVFGADEEGKLGVAAELLFETPPVALPDGVEDVGAEGLDLLIEQVHFIFIAAVADWMRTTSRICPLCAGTLKESVIQLPGTPATFRCSDCSWEPQIPSSTINPHGDRHGPN